MAFATIADVGALMERIAPLETALAWDNVGLLVGDRRARVNCALLCVDCTMDVVREAQEVNAQLIIAHHPLLFSPVQKLVLEEPETAIIAQLLTRGIGLYSAHSNLDAAKGGVASALAGRLGLTNIKQHGLFCMGECERTLGWKWKQRAQDLLGADDVRLFGDGMEQVSRIAAIPGAGGDEFFAAKEQGAQLIITGEAKYHEILWARAHKIPLIEVGHFYSEAPVLNTLLEGLQNLMNGLEFKLRLCVSAVNPYKG